MSALQHHLLQVAAENAVETACSDIDAGYRSPALCELLRGLAFMGYDGPGGEDLKGLADDIDAREVKPPKKWRAEPETTPPWEPSP